MKKVISSYLIQRAKFKNIKKEDIVGVDSLIGLDYMGYAEFEFGEVPKSLRRIVSEYKNYSMNEVEQVKTVDNKTMFVYCCNTYAKETIDVAINISSKRHGGYKAFCDMYDYLNGEKSRNDFWWDIENDFMVFLAKKMPKKFK